MNALRAAVAGLLVISCGPDAPPPVPEELEPLEPPRASGTAPLPSCPEGDGPQEREWDCRLEAGARLRLDAELEDGALRLRLEGEGLPPHRPIQASIDVEPDGRADAVISARVDGSGAIAFEQFHQTCAAHLGPATAQTDFCELVIHPGSAATGGIAPDAAPDAGEAIVGP